VTPWAGDGLARALAGATVLVSAVPAAAWANPATGAGIDRLAGGAAVLEMAYGGETPLAVAARARGAAYADGLGMLVHQAAHAIALALGKTPPLAPLFDAVRVSA
jgi:shikimate 5-dehydrogenase